MTNRNDEASPRAAGQNVALLIELLKLASIIGRPMKEAVADPHELSTNELRVLMCLAGEGPLAGQDISMIMSIPPMNVSRALAVLSERGWTEQASNKGNRRRRPVQLSPAGWQAYRALLPDVRLVARRLFASLEREERQHLAHIFNRLIAQVEAWEFVVKPSTNRNNSWD
ncbi:MAG TPA: MarR family transcriptional regulator [Caulobacteraceae bacterium]